MTRGVVYVAYGPAAHGEAVRSIQSLQKVCDLPVVVVSDHPLLDCKVRKWPARGKTNHVVSSRWAKVNLDSLSPFEQTLYLDADTRVHGDVMGGFRALDDGWDVAMAHSARQDGDVLGNVQVGEREKTFEELGMVDVLGLQAGVMFVQWCEATRRLWVKWREEWERFQEQDQAALLRAMQTCPVRLFLLGRDWNGGEIVEHLFGAAKG